MKGKRVALPRARALHETTAPARRDERAQHGCDQGGRCRLGRRTRARPLARIDNGRGHEDAVLRLAREGADRRGYEARTVPVHPRHGVGRLASHDDVAE